MAFLHIFPTFSVVSGGNSPFAVPPKEGAAQLLSVDAAPMTETEQLAEDAAKSSRRGNQGRNQGRKWGIWMNMMEYGIWI